MGIRYQLSAVRYLLRLFEVSDFELNMFLRDFVPDINTALHPTLLHQYWFTAQQFSPATLLDSPKDL